MTFKANRSVMFTVLDECAKSAVPVLVHAQWGSGKTAMIENWARERGKEAYVISWPVLHATFIDEREDGKSIPFCMPDLAPSSYVLLLEDVSSADFAANGGLFAFFYKSACDIDAPLILTARDDSFSHLPGMSRLTVCEYDPTPHDCAVGICEKGADKPGKIERAFATLTADVVEDYIEVGSKLGDIKPYRWQMVPSMLASVYHHGGTFAEAEATMAKAVGPVFAHKFVKDIYVEPAKVA